MTIDNMFPSKEDGEQEHVEEDMVQNALVNGLRSQYDRRADEDSVVKEEHLVRTDDDNYIIDVIVESRNIAIECKDNKITSIKSGIGQAVRYEINGWSSYLCIPSSASNKKIIDMCLQSGIGLIEVTDHDLASGKKINIQVQNDVKVQCTESGYIRNNNGIDIPKILDVLEVNTIDDVVSINEKLNEIRLDEVDDDRWRNTMRRHDILPENN